MGYYSDVRIKLKKQDYNKLLKVANQSAKDWLLKTENMCVNTIQQEEIYNHIKDDWETTDVVYFGWNSVKWYDGYEDVDCVMNFIQDCKYYAFARIGEETGDIEHEEKNSWEISIRCDFEE